MDAIKECLVAARKKIEDPRHWTQGALGRDENEDVVDVNDACKWCAAGAVWAVCDGDNARVARRRLDKAAQALFRRRSIITVNDDNFELRNSKKEVHARVLQIYDRAIKSLG